MTDHPEARAILDSQEWAWRERLITFLIPRLKGDNAEKETVMQMVTDGISQARNDGVKDSIYILGKLVASTNGERRRAFEIAHRALTELHRLNAKDAG